MEAGFVVDLARNGLDGHHLAMSETYDLVVLDVMLPDVDGWRIVRSLRDAGKQVPVLFLTARGSVDDRVKGLELGDRKSTRLNSSHLVISYAVFCLKKKNYV